MQTTSIRPLTVALAAIARPTFDVPLAQSVADTAARRLHDAGFGVVGTAAELLMDAAAAERAIAALAGVDFDCLVILQASFADSSMALHMARTLQSSGAPLILWAVPDQRDGGRLRLNSLCGINLAGHALMLNGIDYDYVLAAADDPTAVGQIAVAARAGRARRQLAGARIGLVGEHPAGFDTCRYDSDDLQSLFGVAVEKINLADLLAAAAEAPQPARSAFVERAATLAPNLAELEQTAVNGTAGVYVALAAEVERRKLHGVAVRCWPEFITELGCAACGAMSMLTEDLCPASCEADVNGTLTLALLQALSGEQAFISDLVSIDGGERHGRAVALWAGAGEHGRSGWRGAGDDSLQSQAAAALSVHAEARAGDAGAPAPRPARRRVGGVSTVDWRRRDAAGAGQLQRHQRRHSLRPASAPCARHDHAQRR